MQICCIYILILYVQRFLFNIIFIICATKLGFIRVAVFECFCSGFKGSGGGVGLVTRQRILLKYLIGSRVFFLVHPVFNVVDWVSHDLSMNTV